MRWCAIALLLLLGCRAEEPSSLDAPETPRPGRIILISMDTVRADRIDGYGAHGITPRLREISAEGVRFRDFYAASSYTLPSTMSLFTGLDPLEHGVVNEVARLDHGELTLAEALEKAGYRTQGFHEGGYVSERFGFADGFEAYTQKTSKLLVSSALWGVLDWMRESADEPYFLFLHTYAAHSPYGGFERYRGEHPERKLFSAEELKRLHIRYPPETRKWGPASNTIDASTRLRCTLYNLMSENIRQYLGCGDNRLHASFQETPHFEQDRAALLASYDDLIQRLDRAIGEIRKLLLELEQWNDTLLVITSDHGEAFFEHGLFEHGYAPFDEVLKVPLIISYPRLFPRGRVISGLSWHPDLFPTIVRLAGAPQHGRGKGLDLTPIMLGTQEIPAGRTIFPLVLREANWAYMPSRRVALSETLKWIQGHESFGDTQGLLFDLATSPDEKQNLREQRPEAVTALEALLDDYEAQLELGTPVHQQTGKHVSPMPGEVPSDFEPSDKEREEMRALGYVL